MNTADLFKNTNFGGTEATEAGRVGLMVECILKTSAGYGDGYTIKQICRGAGFLEEHGDTPTDRGLRWAFNELYKRRGTGKTIVETMEEA